MSEAVTGRVDRLETAVFIGIGDRPALVTHAAVTDKRLDDVEESQKKWNSIAWKMLAAGGMALLGLAGQLARDYLTHAH